MRIFYGVVGTQKNRAFWGIRSWQRASRHQKAAGKPHKIRVYDYPSVAKALFPAHPASGSGRCQAETDRLGCVFCASAPLDVKIVSAMKSSDGTQAQFPDPFTPFWREIGASFLDGSLKRIGRSDHRMMRIPRDGGTKHSEYPRVPLRPVHLAHQVYRAPAGRENCAGNWTCKKEFICRSSFAPAIVADDV